MNIRIYWLIVAISYWAVRAKFVARCIIYITSVRFQSRCCYLWTSSLTAFCVFYVGSCQFRISILCANYKIISINSIHIFAPILYLRIYKINPIRFVIVQDIKTLYQALLSVNYGKLIYPVSDCFRVCFLSLQQFCVISKFRLY